MFITDIVDEECDLDASVLTTHCVQRSDVHFERGLGGVVHFIESDPNNVASTLERRGRVLHSQEATGARTAKEHWKASLDIEIRRTLRHYHAHEMILWKAIANLEQRREWDLKQLEREEDGEGYYVPGWEEVQSDYEPTECGNE
jgi:hypothetical protein